MPKVFFLPDNKQVEVSLNENLLRAAMVAEVYINAPCGGDGTCGRCKVIIDKGKVEQKPSTKLSPEEMKEGYVLACLSFIKSELEVRIPVETRLGRPPELRERVPAAGRLFSAKEWEERLVAPKLNPFWQKFYVELPPPSLDDSLSDLERVVRELKRKYRLKSVEIDFPVLKYLGKVLRESNWKITVTFLNEEGRPKIVAAEKGDTSSKHYGVAIDVGTTTVVAELIDLNEGQVLAKASNYNAQASCGEDVISRMVFSTKEKGLQKLQNLVVKTINGLIEDLVKKTSISPSKISGFLVAGNTTMLHLLLGIDPSHIRESPYIPLATFFPPLKAKEIGIEVCPEAYLSCYPCVASYMGGDIVAGVLASGMFKTERLSLYIDIGTNGEIVLGNKEFLVSCSCSAGPAFEGGGVKFGMRATRGAIESVRICPETFEPMILTLGNTKPRGICGSGLVDTLAELFLKKVIDQKGKINLDLDTARVREKEFGGEYVLVFSEETGIGKDIVITEVDMENLIRAKAAVFAGISILTESTGVTLSDIQEVFIAGAFGNYLDLGKVVAIGLLPEIPLEKFTFVGNGSLLGAHLACLSRDIQKEAQKVAKKMTYLELSTNPKFMEEYISALFLPHTNIDIFPSVIEALKNQGV